MSTDTMTESRAAEIQGENIRRRQQLKELKAKLDEATRALAERDARLAGLAKQAEEATAEAARLRAMPDADALRKELWRRDHKDAFRKLAAEAKVRPEATDDLWSLLGIDPAGPDVDEPGYRKTIAEAVQARSYLIASEEAAPSPGARGGAHGGLLGDVPGKPGPGAGRPTPEPSQSSDPRRRALEAARARFGGGDNPFRIA
jgi:hypothetical protein